MVVPIRDRNPRRRRPYMVWALLALNCLVYVALQPHTNHDVTLRVGIREYSVDARQAFSLKWAGIPCEITQQHPLTYGEAFTERCSPRAGTGTEASNAVPSTVARTEIYPDKPIWVTPVIAIFLHGSIWHLLGNLLFLWVFGAKVEDRFGPWGFLGFYLAAGIVATAVQFAFTLHSTTPVLGASGAIAGLMGAYLVLWPKAKILSFVPLLLFVVVEIPAFVVLLIWFGLQFFTAPDAQVAWIAHVGGFVFGMLVALAVRLIRTEQDVSESTYEPTAYGPAF